MEVRESALFGLELITKKTYLRKKLAYSSCLLTKTPMEPPFRLILCPPSAKQEEASDYLWAVWEVMVDVVRSPDATSEIHEHIVSILQGLALVAEGRIGGMEWFGSGNF